MSKLVNYDQARTALALATEIDEVKAIRDKAEALRVYHKQIGESLEGQNQWAKIKLRAEREAGRLIREKQDAGELATSDTGRPNKGDTVSPLLTLKDYGIARHESSRWQSLADIPDEQFEQYIETKETKGDEITTAGALRIAKEIKREKKREENREIIKSAPPLSIHRYGQKYKAIALDPPWDWGDEGDVDQMGRAKPTYGTMSIQEIYNLPVPDLADKDSHIYLWITNRSLPKGFGLLEHWGYRYITTITWCKPHFGMGNYFRGASEQILFGVRGSLPLLRNDVPTWFLADRGERHSEKPSEFYEIVETCSPAKWLEMFSRKERNGWTTWGAEV